MEQIVQRGILKTKQLVDTSMIDYKVPMVGCYMLVI